MELTTRGKPFGILSQLVELKNLLYLLITGGSPDDVPSYKPPFIGDFPLPICSMYGIFTNICPKNHPNVGKYTSTMEYMGNGKSQMSLWNPMNITRTTPVPWGRDCPRTEIAENIEGFKKRLEALREVKNMMLGCRVVSPITTVYRWYIYIYI